LTTPALRATPALRGGDASTQFSNATLGRFEILDQPSLSCQSFVQRKVLEGGSIPGIIRAHGIGHQGGPLFFVAEGGYGTADSAKQGRSLVRLEAEACAFTGSRIEIL